MGCKVLVVDDSGVMRKIIVRALNTCGVTDVVEAGDGVEALAKLNAASFDLVMTDWNMPNKNGLQLLQEIRSGGNAVPVIMITTEAEGSRVKEAIQAGVNDYLTKPFENDVLKSKIDKFVSVCA
jgi:two-component system chemotaxis response regulator CheY